jgi:dimethylaniline monooxygenase (N-oxide forming)
MQATAEKCIPPQLLSRIVSRKVRGIMKTAFGDIDPSWRLDPAPPLDVSVPVVSDTLIDHLRAGDVRSAPGVRRIVSPNKIELDDGTTIEADALICCTGYKNDFRILDSRFDPSARPSSEWTSSPGAKGRPLPRLYRNVFSLDQPDSLAFVGCVWFATGAFCLADLTSMCIAQVWAGKSSLPPAREMSRWADAQERRICSLAQRGSPIPTSVPQREWLLWADRTAGMGVFDSLGWGCTGWRFWWRERELCRYMMDGTLTAATWRVFDKGKRKPWEGARAEIVRVNEAAREEERAR